MPTVRVGVVQAGSELFDRDRSLEKALEWLRQAAREGARLVVFPEAFLGGYPKGEDFGARVGMRSPEGRTLFRRYFESACEVPGPETAALAEQAKRLGTYVVVGVIERDGGTLYCTALFISPEGSVLGKHRKVMPTAMERLIWGFGDGSTLPVFQTDVGRIGAVICWENYMPLLRTAMYAQGVEIYCAPTVDDRETWTPTMRHIALEGRCFVVSACQYTSNIRGGSVIVDPLGQILAGPVYGTETLLLADLDLGRIAEGKYDLDVTGHYARPDLFRLLVNRRPMPAAEFRDNGWDDA